MDHSVFSGREWTIRSKAETRGDILPSSTRWGSTPKAEWRNIGLQGYYYVSTETLLEAPVDRLDRDGMTFEADYTFEIGRERLDEIVIYGRYGFANEDTVDAKRFKWVQYGGGVQFNLASSFHANVSYLVQSEQGDAPEADNNVFTLLSLVYEF